MRRNLLSCSLWLVAFATAAAPLHAFADPGPARLDGESLERAFVPGEVIVRFAKTTTAGERLGARRAAGVSFERSLEAPRAQLVETDASVAATVERLEDQEGVVYAQPNYRYRAFADPPDDTFFGDLWGLEDSPAPDPGVNGLAAWDATRGAGQVIAVVDTGVALDHPDIAPNLWTGPGGIHGADFVDGDEDPDDYNFHGTHVAGTAAAAAGNGLGIAGVAPEAEIMAVRALDGDGSGSSADIGEGIAFAAQNGADVINLSLGGPAGVGDIFMSNAVTLADQLDAVVVAAAGNDGSDNDAQPTTPCTLPQQNLICVAAVNRSGGLAGFSNFGASTVDVGAPGTSILSAKTDYAPVFAEDFDTSLAAWDTFTATGSLAWARTTDEASSGTHSVTESPGGALYPNDADSELFTADPLDLTDERGCRIHLDLIYEIEDPDSDGSLFDYLFVGGVTSDSEVFDGLPFAGESFGYDTGTFVEEEASISDLDGRADVFPFLGLFSDATVRGDGAYADDVRVLCRDATYLDDKTAAGSYVAFQGTSMAAPHVAGVAALVRAADPGASDTQVIDAIEAGGTPLASLAGTTSSGRAVDAAGAIAAAIGTPNPPAARPPGAPQGAAPVTPTAPAPAPPAKPVLGGASKVRVSRRGRFSFRFTAKAGLSGLAAFRNGAKPLARKRFAVGPTGRVRVTVKLGRAVLRKLRRKRRLTVTATVTVRDANGLTASAKRRFKLLAPRR